MKKGLKIVTIGGGSSYTPEIIEGFIQKKLEGKLPIEDLYLVDVEEGKFIQKKLEGKLPIEDLYLVDVEEGKEKLEIVGNLAKRMVEESGAGFNVHLTLDRRAALKDADFVTTQFRVGLLDARIRDERIPLKYDLIGQETNGAGGFMNRAALKDADFVTTQFRVGLLDARIRDERIPLKYDLIGQETNGAGGFMKAMRTIPVILDICKDIRELCPDAWLVNFTNPSGIITETILKHGGVKAIGLCNVPLGMQVKCAKLFDVDPSRVYVEC